MLVMVFLVFIVHVLNGRPPIETLLFSIALAVGLSPELLPAILSVNLARGAQMMARHGVLVRHLTAIENLGSMDVLCTDKTGTLTEGVVRAGGCVRCPRGRRRQTCRSRAPGTRRSKPAWRVRSTMRFSAPARRICRAVRKLAEIPFDFIRKRVSVVVEAEGRTSLITKGAFHHVLEICTRSADGVVARCRGEGAPRGALSGLERTGHSRAGGRVANGRARSRRTAGSWSGI